MPKYIYQPFDKPDSEIRLLRISKDPLTHEPQCTLQKYSLINCPQYTALSYTWGEPMPTHNVAIDGADIEIRQNLFDFLHSYITESWGMNDVKRPVFYWIDQICINQEDLVERSDQVSIMGKIYKQATYVRVWLGCDSTMIEAARRRRDKEDDDEWGLATILAHRYFSRIWVIQEIALSVNPPLIVCGGIELDWDRIHFPMKGTQRTPPVAAIGTIYGYSRLREGRTLGGCIQSHCGSDCYDPRDKVYGLLGLTPEKWRVRVDYTKEVLEVYFDAVAAMYEELFDLSDPECLYPKELSVEGELSVYHYKNVYRDTSLVLGEAMGIPQQQRGGLREILRYVQTEYLRTKIRNVQYTYTGLIYTRVRAQSSSGQVLSSEDEEVEVSWGSVTATRRNPLMRDIIPEMGLQLGSKTTESTAGQNGDYAQSQDRWWYKHGGKIHYFDPCANHYSFWPFNSPSRDYGGWDESFDPPPEDLDPPPDDLDEEWVYVRKSRWKLA